MCLPLSLPRQGISRATPCPKKGTSGGSSAAQIARSAGCTFYAATRSWRFGALATRARARFPHCNVAYCTAILTPHQSLGLSRLGTSAVLIEVKAQNPSPCDDCYGKREGIMAYVDTRGTLFLGFIELWRNWPGMRRDLADVCQSHDDREVLARSPGDLGTITAKWPGQSDLVRGA
jgi:hypothetical protein